MSRIARGGQEPRSVGSADRPCFMMDSEVVRLGHPAGLRGTCVAPFCFALLTMSALTLPGCLITQPVQFEAPSGSPPSITGGTTHESHPLDEIILLRVGDPVVGDAGAVSTATPIVVEVRDPDVDQELAYKVYVDYNASDPRPPNRSDFLPALARSPGVDRTRRRLEFPLPTGLTTVGCHRIELVVSSGFRPDTREPLREGDLATAVWWVATEPMGGGLVDMVSCP